MRLAIACVLALLGACSSASRKADNLAPAPPAQPITAVQAQGLDASALGTANPFARWTAVIIAGDYRAQSGGRTQAFDNARRDVASAFVAAGFAREHVRQFSAQPDPADSTSPAYTSPDAIRGAVHLLLGEAGEGCLFYITSHGDRTGISFNEDKLTPEGLKGLIDRTCGGRPAVIFLSACHSGIFVPALSAPNHMVMTAARPDRTSFGCGENNKYPYFDDCVVQAAPNAPSFPKLADEVKACVASKEAAQKFLPSEPQVSIGADVESLLQHARFKRR
jgi:hypothetical protein